MWDTRTCDTDEIPALTAPTYAMTQPCRSPLYSPSKAPALVGVEPVPDVVDELWLAESLPAACAA
ncbi:hypothetical protein ACFOHQ_08050 [Xanthomonas fragariae]